MMKVLWVAVLLAAAAFASYGQEQRKFKDVSEVPRVAIEDAKKAFDAGSALFVDARSLDVYKEEHIKGAIDVPFGAPDAQVNGIPKGKTIIVYCSWPHEHSSAGLAFQLNQKGFKDVFALEGGFHGWKAANYPVEKGDR